MTWDIFCRVIDNHGDLGVSWRLSCQLAARGIAVRLWVDDPSALRWMAPHGHAGVSVHTWTSPLNLQGITPGEVLVETFGCEVAPEFIAAFAASTRPKAWINLEYLSAEPYAQRCHALPSPVMHGPGKGLTKHFFYPGFTLASGGLLREPDLTQRQDAFDAPAWLRGLGLTRLLGARLVSLFCYEPPALDTWLTQLQAGPHTTQLLVTAGRAQAAVNTWLQTQHPDKRQQLALDPTEPIPATPPTPPTPPTSHTPPSQPTQLSKASALFDTLRIGQLQLHSLPLLSQTDYDHLLWACDVNFVRGEDSVVRALLSRAPFIWHIYPQDDQAHHAKLQAFLDVLSAPSDWRAWHEVWNGLQQQALPALDTAVLERWRASLDAPRQSLWAQPDLASKLLAFAQERLAQGLA